MIIAQIQLTTQQIHSYTIKYNGIQTNHMELSTLYNAIFMHCMKSHIHIQAKYNIQIHINIIHILYNIHINNDNNYTHISLCHKRRHSTANTTQRILRADIVTADE